MRVLTIVCALALLSSCSGDDDTSASVSTSRSTTGSATTSEPAPTTSTTAISTPADVAAPGDPDAVAAVLGRVEQELRSPTRDESQLARTAWEQDVAYATLRAHADWVADVLPRLPDSVRPIVAANVHAGAQISELNEPRPELPAWTIRPPRPREELVGFYREAEAATEVGWQYLAAIHLVETRLGRIVGTSVAGAQGPMQFMPPSWEAYGEGDVYDDRDAILAAGRYLAAAGAPDDMDAAIFSYNHSDRYVAAIRAYAQAIIDDPRAYDGYYYWQVHYATTTGTYLLPEGYTNGSGAVPLEL